MSCGALLLRVFTLDACSSALPGSSQSPSLTYITVQTQQRSFYRRHHITSMPASLHWRPNHFGIDFKNVLVTSEARMGPVPTDMRELLIPAAWDLLRLFRYLPSLRWRLWQPVHEFFSSSFNLLYREAFMFCPYALVNVTSSYFCTIKCPLYVLCCCLNWLRRPLISLILNGVYYYILLKAVCVPVHIDYIWASNQLKCVCVKPRTKQEVMDLLV